MLHAHAWLKLNCVPKNLSHSISCFAPCLTPCTVHPAFRPLFHFPLLLLLSPARAQALITSRIHCADSRDLRGNGFTDPEPRTLGTSVALGPAPRVGGPPQSQLSDSRLCVSLGQSQFHELVDVPHRTSGAGVAVCVQEHKAILSFSSPSCLLVDSCLSLGPPSQ